MVLDTDKNLEKFSYSFLENVTLPFDVSESLLDNARLSYLDYLGGEDVLENSLVQKYIPDNKSFNPKAIIAVSVKLGILAEYLELYDFAKNLYKIADKRSYLKHLEYKQNNHSLEWLISNIDEREANEISGIYFKKDSQIYTCLKERQSEVLRGKCEYLKAAKVEVSIGNFDGAYRDIETLIESKKKLNYKDASSIMSIARITKKKGFENYAVFFDFALQIYEEKKSYYQIARAYYESERKEEAFKFFKKAKCFQRALNINKSLKTKVSRTLAKNLVEQQTFLAERNFYSNLSFIPDLDEDVKKTMLLYEKPIKLAKRYSVEDFMLKLFKKRFLLNTGLRFAKEIGYKSQESEILRLVEQQKQLNQIITPLTWNTYFLSNIYDKYACRMDKDLTMVTIFSTLPETCVNDFLKLEDENGLDNSFNVTESIDLIFKLLNVDPLLLNALKIKEYSRINEILEDESVILDYKQILRDNPGINIFSNSESLLAPIHDLHSEKYYEFLNFNLPGVFFYLLLDCFFYNTDPLKVATLDLRMDSFKKYSLKAKRLGAYRSF
jgi:hypothetical protein